MNGSIDSFEVTHGCGHTAVRSKKPRFPVRSLCAACLHKHSEMRSSIFAAARERWKEAVATNNLIGSLKQCEWAERIRSGWLENVVKFEFREVPAMELVRTKLLDSNAAATEIEEAVAAVLNGKLTAVDQALTHTKASWWIERFKHGMAFASTRSAEDDVIRSTLSMFRKRDGQKTSAS